MCMDRACDLININFPLGDRIGVGSERWCYVKASDPSRCLKISKKTNCNQTLREIKYFEFMKRRGIKAFFLPEIYDIFENREYIGYEQECFLIKDRGGVYDEACSLDKYILDCRGSLEEVQRELNELKQEMMAKNIICSDLSASNILKVRRGGCSRLVVIDGFGATELFPVCKYLKLFGKKKLERQWEKLERRIGLCLKC